MLNAWSDTYDINFSPSFNITGGEPFLRQDIFKILEEIKRRGFDLYILSNGIPINRKKARMLAGLGVKGVQVSIEGPEKIHEIISGKDSFSSSVKGVCCLLEAGVKVTLNMTLSEINAGYFMDMVELSSSLLGFRGLDFQDLSLQGGEQGF